MTVVTTEGLDIAINNIFNRRHSLNIHLYRIKILGVPSQARGGWGGEGGGGIISIFRCHKHDKHDK